VWSRTYDVPDGGLCSVPRWAGWARSRRVVSYLPYVVVDAGLHEVEPVSAYLRDLMLGDVSPLRCRSYGFGLLRWYRLICSCRPLGRRPRKPRSRCWWAGCGRRATRGGSASERFISPARVGESEDGRTVAAGGYARPRSTTTSPW
jgi:hypothetical protein